MVIFGVPQRTNVRKSATCSLFSTEEEWDAVAFFLLLMGTLLGCMFSWALLSEKFIVFFSQSLLQVCCNTDCCLRSFLLKPHGFLKMLGHYESHQHLFLSWNKYSIYEFYLNLNRFFKNQLRIVN